MAVSIIPGKVLGAIRYIPEVTFGVTPTTDTWQLVPHQTMKLEGSLKFPTENNILPNRQAETKLPIGIDKISVTGNGLYQLGMFIRHYASVLGTTTIPTIETIGPLTTLAAVASGNKITGPSGTWANFTVGQYARFIGFVTNAPDFVALVTAKTSTDLSLSTSNITLVNESAGPSVKAVRGIDLIADGITLRSFTWEHWVDELSAGQTITASACTELSVTADASTEVKWSGTWSGLEHADTSSELTGDYANSGRPTGVTIPAANIGAPDFFGGADVPVGVEFRFGGAAAPNLFLQKLGLKITGPQFQSAAVGHQNFVGGGLDGLVSVAVEVDFLASAAAEAAYADRRVATDMLFCARDVTGALEVFHFPSLSGDLMKSGREQSGPANITGTLMAGSVSPWGSFHYAYFPPA